MNDLDELMKVFGEAGGNKAILENNEIAHLVASGHKLQREKPREFDDLLHHGNIAAAFISPQFYMKNRMMSDLEFLVAPQINGEPYYYPFIIVRKKAEISNIADLRGKRFALGKPEFELAELAPMPIAGAVNH